MVAVVINGLYSVEQAERVVKEIRSVVDIIDLSSIKKSLVNNT